MKLEDIKNPINQFATAAKRIGISNEEISVAVAEFRAEQLKAKVGLRLYECTCNNWGPRWIENSQDGCCPGCFQWALDHHYEVPTSKLDPNRVTREMIENNTWGINVAQLDKNRTAGIKRDPDVPSFFDNLDWIGEDK